MSKLRITITGLTAAAVIAGLAGLNARAAEGENAPAKPKHRFPAAGENFIPPAFVKQVALTADQQTKYEALVTEYQKDAATWMKDHNFDLQKWRTDMQAAHQAKDRVKIKELAAERQGLTEIGKQYREKFQALLTPDQQKKLDELVHAHHHAPRPNAGAGQAPAAPPAAPAPPPAGQ